jgi:trimeric autotransporter adhesin
MAGIASRIMGIVVGTVLTSFALVVITPRPAFGQLDLSSHGTNYFETFNTIGSGLPPGWTVHISATAGSLGSSHAFTTDISRWNIISAQFANYASAISDAGTNFNGGESTITQSNCVNRAAGMRQVGSATEPGFDPGAAFVLQLLNTSNRFNIQLNFDFLTLDVEVRAAIWTVDFAVGASPTSFLSAGTVEDPRVFGRTNVSFSFGGALDDQNNPVWIRIAALSITTPNSGNRSTVALDNFSLSWTSGVTAPPPLIPLNIQSAGGEAILTWTNSACDLQSAVTINSEFTTINGATSPYTNPIIGGQMLFRLVRTNSAF